jgi:hypothetical protein
MAGIRSLLVGQEFEHRLPGVGVSTTGRQSVETPYVLIHFNAEE